jgi:hypothetical protein
MAENKFAYKQKTPYQDFEDLLAIPGNVFGGIKDWIVNREPPDPNKPSWAPFQGGSADRSGYTEGGKPQWVEDYIAKPIREGWRMTVPTQEDDPNLSHGYNLFRNFLPSVYNWQTRNRVAIGDWVADTAQTGADYLQSGLDWLGKPAGEYDKKYRGGAKTEQEGGSAPRGPLDALNEYKLHGEGITSGGPTGPQETKLASYKQFIPAPPPELKPFIQADPPEIKFQPYPDAPQRQAFDYGPWLEKFDEFKPEDIDRQQYMRERFLSNLSRAFAAGASGSGHSGAGGALARFGAGFGTAQANTTDAYLKEQQGVDEAQRMFGLKRLEMEMTGKKEQQDIDYENRVNQYEVTTKNIAGANEAAQANADRKYQVATQNAQAMHETNQQNAGRMWDYDNQIGAMKETKITPSKNGMVIEETDKDGNRTFKYVDFTDKTMGGIYTKENLDWLKKMEDAGNQDTLAYKTAKYLPLFQSGDMISVHRAIIDEAIKGNQLDALMESGVIDDNAMAEAQEKAQNAIAERQLDPTSEDGQEVFQQVLTQTLMESVNLNDWRVLEGLASRNNYGATLLYEYARRAEEARRMPPAGSGIGPR